jgi:hypothetical protein
MRVRRNWTHGFVSIGLIAVLGTVVVPGMPAFTLNPENERASPQANKKATPPLPAESSPSRDERITAIQKLYAQIQDRISRAFKEAEGLSPSGFYSTDILVNSRNGSWRASGNYSKKTVFWYTDQPEFAEDGAEDGISVLVKVEIDETAAVRSHHREFLFDQGRLIFAFVKTPGENGPAEERRYYFKDGLLIRHMLGQRSADTKPDTAALFAEIKSLQALFLSTFK